MRDHLAGDNRLICNDAGEEVGLCVWQPDTQNILGVASII